MKKQPFMFKLVCVLVIAFCLTITQTNYVTDVKIIVRTMILNFLHGWFIMTLSRVF